MTVGVWTDAQRATRRHALSRLDQRTPFQRDRDRILYCSAFRRLAGVTQIVAADEADVFHTRQQHTLKVAQLGRRLAQRCLENQREAATYLGLDPEVVEAACLAHDLGHPPFGHVGEKALHEKVMEAKDLDGYEGNAQSFRILTKLALRYEQRPGLDLTRATLAAVLKYPWFREAGNSAKEKKWSAYTSEEEDFKFARELLSHDSKTAEAELMDYADDIAYSIHDLEDFHRCAALPWTSILSEQGTEKLVAHANASWWRPPYDSEGRLREACRSLSDFLLATFGAFLSERYDGSKTQRVQLRRMTSLLIGRYIDKLKLKNRDEIEADGVCVKIESNFADEIKILKQITRDYIINVPSLAAQQRGHRRIVEQLFEDLYEDSVKDWPVYLPVRLRYLWAGVDRRARFAADCISSLSEAEALALHARLRGLASGSVLDPIVR
jgi:dGTPase